LEEAGRIEDQFTIALDISVATHSSQFSIYGFGTETREFTNACSIKAIFHLKRNNQTYLKI
jgi:hypothetical protein